MWVWGPGLGGVLRGGRKLTLMTRNLNLVHAI